MARGAEAAGVAESEPTPQGEHTLIDLLSQRRRRRTLRDTTPAGKALTDRARLRPGNTDFGGSCEGQEHRPTVPAAPPAPAPQHGADLAEPADGQEHCRPDRVVAALTHVAFLDD
jgi:hypothetical protein